MSSSFMADIGSLGAASVTAKKSTSREGNTEMKMEDFLKLMIVQLQNQTIDDTADTGEMLNQLVQMQMVTALSNMTDASVMSYASSLVGKEVTIGYVDRDGTLHEDVLKVTGTGLYSGQQVIFCEDGNMYQLNQIMAVGRLPETDEAEEDDENAANANSGAIGPNYPVTDVDKETKARLDALNASIKNNTFDPDSIGYVDNVSNANDVGAVNAPESAQPGGNDAAAADDGGVRDPFKGGFLDGILVSPNPNPADVAYSGELGADTAASE